MARAANRSVGLGRMSPGRCGGNAALAKRREQIGEPVTAPVMAKGGLIDAPFQPAGGRSLRASTAGFPER